MIDLEKTPKIKVHVPTPEISKKVQEKLFAMGCDWWGRGKSPVHILSKALYVDNKKITQTSSTDYFSECPENTEVRYQDIIHEGFEVGDKVRAFGLNGVVIKDWKDTIEVTFEGRHSMHFFSDGTYFTWHKEPSLVLIERPLKKVLKSFYVWSDEKGKITDKVVNPESARTPSGEFVSLFGLKLIPGTEIELEVEASLFGGV